MKFDVAALNKMSDEELRALNSTVVTLLKGRMKSKAVVAAQGFQVGQKVQWNSKRGYPVQGVVTKVKIKMIEVDAGTEGRWNVAATLLRAI